MLNRFRIQVILLALVVLLAALPAQAHVWRSSTGNIFRFQSNGTYTILQTNGGSYTGRWWWVQPGYKAEYMYGSTRYLVYIQGTSARVYMNDRGNPSYWTYLGSRGASDKDETAAEAWFMDPVKFGPN